MPSPQGPSSAEPKKRRRRRAEASARRRVFSKVRTFSVSPLAHGSGPAYEVPSGTKDFSVSFQEYFEDETTGDVFFVYFTAGADTSA